MNFEEMLTKAKNGDNTAVLELMNRYKPLILKTSIVNGVFDEDLYQEQCLVFLKCIRMFNM